MHNVIFENGGVKIFVSLNTLLCGNIALNVCPATDGQVVWAALLGEKENSGVSFSASLSL